jgi:hypothetical protein
MIKYEKIKKKATTFRRLFGVSPKEFDEIISKTRPIWDNTVSANYKRPGRNNKLSFEEMHLVLLLYYRCYVTQEFIGWLFGINKANVCRLIRRLEPILASAMVIRKDRAIQKDELESLIIDATESVIERPKRGQKEYYSGKKKRHTVKTEIRVTKRGRITHISKTVPGTVHDIIAKLLAYHNQT